MTEQIQRTADLRTAGYGKNAVRRMVRAGTLTRLCRGAYTDREPDDAHDPAPPPRPGGAGRAG